MQYLYYYLIAINLVAFVMMGIDKRKAIRHRWRIPERDLFIAVLLGGGLGGCLGMLLFHHKTRHTKFVIGFPAILLLQAVLFFVFLLSNV